MCGSQLVEQKISRMKKLEVRHQLAINYFIDQKLIA
jgi:hypothetical protein